MPDLLTLSEINEYSILAQDVFRRKYSKKEIKIFNPTINFTGEIFLIGDEASIPVQHLELILKILKKFGKFIQRLSFFIWAAHVSASTIDEISSYINLYCSESLLKLRIQVDGNYSTSVFSGMLKPFNAVEEVTLQGRLGKMNSSMLDFNELFPALRNLIVNVVFVENTSFIDRKFPQLEYVSIAPSGLFTAYKPIQSNPGDVEKMIKKNPQIRSIHFQSCTVEVLKTVNVFLPNLENLHIDLYLNGNHRAEELLFFENVKNFTVFAVLFPTNLRFGHLTTFETKSDPNLDWIKFVQRNPFLENLSIKGANIKKQQLQRLATLDWNMKEVYLRLSLDIDDESIVNFVRSLEKIKKITFQRDLYTYGVKLNTFSSVTKILRREFSNKWNVMVHTPSYNLILEA